MRKPALAGKTILLVSPPIAGGYKGTFIAPFVEIVPPLGLLALGPSLRDAGAEPRLLDLSLASDPSRALREALALSRPSVVGFSILTPQAARVRDLVRTVRDGLPSAAVWGGGVHPTIFPVESIRDLDLDAVIVGEGDFAFADALSSPDGEDRAVAVVRQGEALPGKLALDPIAPLDRLPLPGWEMARPEDYARLAPLRRRPRGAAGPIETSRGCVLRCSFCTKAVFGSRFRAKSPERVVVEMRRLKDLGFAEAHVLDDCFNTSMRRAREICGRLVTERVDLPWNCRVGIRPDRVDADLMRSMRLAGCYRVSFGIESGNQGVLDEAGKGLRLEESERAIRIATEVGVETMAFFILGLPGDTSETIAETIAFAKRIRPTFAKFGLFAPLPSTPAYEKLRAEGRLAYRSWEDLSFHRLPPRTFRHPSLSSRQLARAYWRAYASFYLTRRGWLGRLRAWARL